MKNKFIKRISIFVLTLCLIIPVAAMMAMASDTAEVALEERVYQSGYEDSVIDLIKVKKAGDGTDIDGDAMNGNASDLEQMRNFIVGKTDAFYRTQGVKYEFDEETQRYHVISEQSCNAGIEKAEGTLTILSAYDDGKHGKATVTTVAEGAFSDCTEVTAAVMPTVTTLSGSTFSGCSNLVTVDMPKVATLKTSDNFASCSNLATAVVANQFSLSASNFSGEGQSVDICVAGINEPTLNMTLNEGLSGEIYHQNTNGACDTWTYDEEGAIVKAQHKHTFGEDGVCTNENCAVESINGLVFEKNYFAPRNASSLTVEKVDSYEDSSTLDTDSSGITEMNVAKVTTVGTYADFVITLPEDVTDTLTVRILIPSSTATYLRFRTVGNEGECNFGSEIQDLAANSALATKNTDVWLDYTLDYSSTNRAYKDRLTMLVQGQASDAVNTFYVAYAVNTEKIEEKLVAELETPYRADFSSSLCQTKVGVNTFPARGATSVTAQKVDFYSDKNDTVETNVMKITSVANSNKVADFVIHIPKKVTSKATVRMLIASGDAAWYAFRNVDASGNEYYPSEEAKVVPSTGLDGNNTNVWMNINIDYSQTGSDYMDRLTMLIAGGAVGSTHTIYIAYVAETSEIADVVTSSLEEGYLADFSSSFYQTNNLINGKNIVDNGYTVGGNTLQATWLSSFEGEEGVMKILVKKSQSSGYYKADFDIVLPKTHNGKYTMRVWVSPNTNVGQLGIQASGGGWHSNNGISQLSAAVGCWKDVTIDASSDGHNGGKISIMGYDSASTDDTVEMYISWIKEAN